MTVMLPVVQITGSQRFPTTFHYCKSHRCKKYIFYFGHFFTFLTFFLFSKRFFLKTLAKFRAASRLTRSTFKITATKETYDFCCMSKDLKCLIINFYLLTVTHCVTALKAISWASRVRGVELQEVTFLLRLQTFFVTFLRF